MTIGSEPDLKEYFKKIYEKAFDNIIECLETRFNLERCLISNPDGILKGFFNPHCTLIALVFVELC